MNTPRYTLDEETRNFLESVLNMAAIVADAQLSTEASEDAYELLNEVADRFYIHSHSTVPPEEPTAINLDNRPRFRVIVNNDDETD